MISLSLFNYLPVCQYVVHRKCVEKVPDNCRQELIEESDTEEVPDETLLTTDDGLKEDPERAQDEAMYELKHHFVESSLEFGSECYVCGESFDLLAFNAGIRCSRCEKTVNLFHSL